MRLPRRIPPLTRVERRDALKCISTLIEVMRDEAEKTDVRLQAANLLLEHGGDFPEAQEFIQSVKAWYDA